MSAYLPPFWNYYTLVFIGKALWVTVVIAAIGLSVGGALGFALGLARDKRLNDIAAIRGIILIFVEAGRRIPFLVLLFVVFFSVQIWGWDVNKMTAAVVAVALRAAVYFSESVRSGVEAIPQNQWDAAATMNLGRLQTLRLIILPQALPIIIAPATVLFIQLLKSTSIASQVGVIELTGAAKLLNIKGYSAVLCFGTILVLYYLMARCISWLGRLLESHYRASETRAYGGVSVEAQE